MQETNPYKLLRVRRDADDDEIQDAYDSLFDQYEPDAHAGDAEAVSMLEALNEAHETLMDPERRSAIDRELAAARAARQGATMTSGGARQPAPGAYPTTGSKPDSKPSRAGSQKRPRAVVPVTKKRSPMPLIVAGVLLLVVVAGAAFLISRGLGGNAQLGVDVPRGDVVATVNDVPIYRREFNERLEKDKQAALNDPFMSGMVNNFQGVTGTRMLTLISYDALDKLVNLEVIQQEAKKENLYPSENDKKQLIEQAKTQDLHGQSFDNFLKAHHISEEQYNNSVVVNTVYAIMAGKHMPQTGSDDEKTNALIAWMCNARKSYNVKLNLNFEVEGNQPCTSGLPSDVPISGLTAPPQGGTGTEVPLPEATGPVPTAPESLQVTATPKP